MNISDTETNEMFDLSGDFNDALSIIAASDPEFINETNNNNNNNANVQPMTDIAFQCLIEEQQLSAQQSQTVGHHQFVQPTYQREFQNQNHQPLSQHQQRVLAYQRECQRQNQMPQVQNQPTEIRQVCPQIPNQAAQTQQAAILAQNQVSQTQHAAILAQNQLPQSRQIAQVMPQVQNQVSQIRQAGFPIENQTTQFQQAAVSHNQYQQPQLQNQQPGRTLTPEQQRILAAYQQLYNSSQVHKHKQLQQQNQQNFVPQTPSLRTPQNIYPMIPQQQQANPETVVQPKLPVVQKIIQEPTVQNPDPKPYVEIVEQPAARGARFRYGCEIRSNGSIPGISSTPDNKTYPKIRVVGYNGDAVVVVSCVTKEEPYRAHPHNLVGRLWCRNGVCKATMSKDSMSVTFDKLGIQCIKKKDVLNSLNQRQKLNVDPFNNGFDGKDNPGSFDQSCVRLAFQVYLEGPMKGQFKIRLPPVVSDPIYDKKNSPDLTIYKLSHYSAPATGGQDIIILCDKVSKEDIKVRFYEEREEEVIWEAFGDLQRTGCIHKHVAIFFQTPKYKTTDFNGAANVYIELVRPSDGMYSNAVTFDFIPVNDPTEMKRKRKRVHESLLMKNYDVTSHNDQWNIMNQPNFNAIEAR